MLLVGGVAFPKFGHDGPDRIKAGPLGSESVGLDLLGKFSG